MKVEVRKTDEVKPYEQNPRVNDGAVEAVAKSIREFGFRQPIVVDEAGVIIVGHTRWKAAKVLGLAEVPVHVAVGLSPEKARAYRLAEESGGGTGQRPTLGRYRRSLAGTPHPPQRAGAGARALGAAQTTSQGILKWFVQLRQGVPNIRSR